MGVLAGVKTALECTCPEEKSSLAISIYQDWQRDSNRPIVFPEVNDEPGRPDVPELVSPAKVPKRGFGSERGKAALMHAVAHIEFNAINLALDMVLRFANDPIFENLAKKSEFIGDWLSVASDEARHFTLINAYLKARGFEYGTFPAHNGLWDAASDTAFDIAARLAVAPMVLEARGLDVTPQIIEKLRKNREPEAVAILEVILKEEVQHVNFGTKWFNYVAKVRSKDPIVYFQELVRTHYKGMLKKPFNKKARFEAELYEDYYLPLS